MTAPTKPRKTKAKRARKPKQPKAALPVADPYGDKEWLEAKRTPTKSLEEERAEDRARIIAAVAEGVAEATGDVEAAAPHKPPPKMGRPSLYKEEFAKQAEKLCRLGATDFELANFFEVDRETIRRWAARHEDFCGALKSGKAEADERVERSLFHKAVGYQHDAVKIFMPAGAAAPVYAEYVEHVPPDTTAAIFWLKNRRPELWRDKREVTHSGAIGRAAELTDDQLAAIVQEGSGDGTDEAAAGAREPDRVH